MSFDYNPTTQGIKLPVNLQEAVRDLDARLKALEPKAKEDEWTPDPPKK